MEHPDANVVFVCASIDPAVKDSLAKAGIRTLVFADLKPEKLTQGETLPHLSPTEQQAYFALVRNESKVVSTRELASLLGRPIHRARNLLVAMAKRGALFRFGRGKFAVLPPDVLYDRKSYTADPYVVVDAIMKGEQYYVAYGSAAHLHGVATQLPFTVSVAILGQRRPINLGGAQIRFVSVRKARLFGIEEREYFGSSIRVSDLAKTVVDCVDRSDLVGGIDEATRIAAEALGRMDLARLVDYSEKMERQALVQRLGFVLEKLGGAGYDVSGSVLERLERLVRKSYAYPLDPARRKKGRLSPSWHVYENVDCLRWRHA